VMALDLLSWPEIHDAEARVAAAEEARARAVRRALIAPHGEKQARLRAAQEASNEALRAETELARLRREFGA
jgi:hypothetical protein